MERSRYWKGRVQHRRNKAKRAETKRDTKEEENKYKII
jgi:hypothetical protein